MHLLFHLNKFSFFRTKAVHALDRTVIERRTE